MTVLTRAIAPAAVLTAMLAAGCSSASSAPGAGTAATATPAAAASSAAPAASAVIPPSGTPAGTLPAATVQAWPGGTDVYLAESQDPRGTTVHEPGCTAGCPLSGDGTIVLWDMTWSRWDSAEAVGTGTEKIESCNPDCASGGQYSVRVKVTLTQPVKDCGDGMYFWTHAAFTWPAASRPPSAAATAPSTPGTGPSSARQRKRRAANRRSRCDGVSLGGVQVRLPPGAEQVQACLLLVSPQLFRRGHNQLPRLITRAGFRHEHVENPPAHRGLFPGVLFVFPGKRLNGQVVV